MARIILTIFLLLSARAAERDAAAMAYYERGDYAQAAALFTDPQWKALALAQSDQLRGAQALLSRLNNIDSLYNLGLVYAQQGLLRQALESFQRVLEHQPNAEDARANAQLLAQLLTERAHVARGGSGAALQGEKQPANSEGEGGQSGSSGEERSESINEEGEEQAGQSSEQAEGTHESSDRTNERDGGNAGGKDAQALAEGNLGDFESESSRAASSSDESNSDGSAEDGRSHHSLERQLEAQAMEQWFNRIQNDKAQFMRERLQQMSLTRGDIVGEEEVH